MTPLEQEMIGHDEHDSENYRLCAERDLVSLTETWRFTLENKGSLGAMFMNFSKAL